MTSFRRSCSGFSLLELLMAMALFAIAAVSLAQAINMISLSVSESIEDSESREKLRAVLLEISRDPDLREEVVITNPDDQGLFFEIKVTPLNLESRDAEPLGNLFEVHITAKRKSIAKGVEEVDVASTWVYPNIF